MGGAELNSTLASLTAVEMLDVSVIHAIAVRQAVSQGNYTKFFRLFSSAPLMGAYIMDHFVPRERVQALVVMTKACVVNIPHIPLIGSCDHQSLTRCAIDTNNYRYH